MAAPSVEKALDQAIAENTGELPLAAPPCSDCVHWVPKVMRDHTGGVRGLKMCWVPLGHGGGGMKPDFSCFVPRIVVAPPAPVPKAAKPVKA